VFQKNVMKNLRESKLHSFFLCFNNDYLEKA